MSTPATETVMVIADDEAPIRLVVGEKLRSAGITVYEAADGEEALELVMKHNPIAMITDLQMPYMNGLELCMSVKSCEETSTIPAILLTARGHVLSSDMLAQTNIIKVMSKPFGVKELLNIVQTILIPAGQKHRSGAVGAVEETEIPNKEAA